MSPSPVRVTFLGLTYFVAKLLTDLAGEALFPWCDHPVDCFDFTIELSQSVDHSVDACEGLYDHTCAFWALNHPLASSHFDHLNSRIHLELFKLLIKPPQRRSLSVFDKTVAAFSECRAVESKQKENLHVLLDVLKKYSLEWPSLKVASKASVMDALVGLSLDFHFGVIFDFQMTIDFKTDNRYGFALSYSAVNYGAIGKVMGHEITHSFDFLFGDIATSGDKVDWYSKDSRAEFRRKIECVMKQVQNASDIKGIGLSSISESFADTAGLEKACSAFSRIAKGSGLLRYNPDQLFFASGCFAFCASRREGVDKGKIYPPTFLRCDVPAANEAHFADAFKCPKGARLNPTNRCDFH
ncbi:unnamed protein product [Ixodes persulcatus]